MKQMSFDFTRRQPRHDPPPPPLTIMRDFLRVLERLLPAPAGGAPSSGPLAREKP